MLFCQHNKVQQTNTIKIILNRLYFSNYPLKMLTLEDWGAPIYPHICPMSLGQWISMVWLHAASCRQSIMFSMNFRVIQRVPACFDPDPSCSSNGSSNHVSCSSLQSPICPFTLGQCHHQIQSHKATKRSTSRPGMQSQIHGFVNVNVNGCSRTRSTTMPANSTSPTWTGRTREMLTGSTGSALKPSTNLTTITTSTREQPTATWSSGCPRRSTTTSRRSRRVQTCPDLSILVQTCPCLSIFQSLMKTLPTWFPKLYIKYFRPWLFCSVDFLRLAPDHYLII